MPPLPVLKCTRLCYIESSLNLWLCFKWKSFFHGSSQKRSKSLFDVSLYESEFLIDLVAKDLSEESHVVVLFRETSDPVYDCASHLNDETFQPVALV